MIGVDEVGRGCLAGPLLVVAAKSRSRLPSGLKDSKELSREQRLELWPLLLGVCMFGEGWVSVTEINDLGLTKATKLGVRRALKQLKATDDEPIIVDGHINYCAKRFKQARPLIDADATIPIVSAASVYAKVVRDNYMQGVAKLYPDYDFESNVGYGTKYHLAMINKTGIIRGLHRINYSPVRLFIEANSEFDIYRSGRRIDRLSTIDPIGL